MQVLPQCFILFPAVYMHMTGGIRVVDPASNRKQTSYPKFGTKECIKAHHRSFQCPLPVNVGEVKSKCHIYWLSKTALNRHLPYYKEDEKQPTTELKELDRMNQGINEENTGEAEWRRLFEKHFWHFQVLIWGYWVAFM